MDSDDTTRARRPDRPRRPGSSRPNDPSSVKPSDRQNVTGKDLARVYATQDEQLQPAVGFEFNRQGARKFGSLTREHLPEEDGVQVPAWRSSSTTWSSRPPSIKAEIRDSGIIEGGAGPNQGGQPPDQDPPVGQPAGEPEPRRRSRRRRSGPTLGEDTIAKGIRAIVDLDARRADLHDRLLPLRGRRGGRRPGAEHDPAARLDGLPPGHASRCPAWRAWP